MIKLYLYNGLSFNFEETNGTCQPPCMTVMLEN